MVLSKALVIKGLGAGVAAAGVGIGFYYGGNFYKHGKKESDENIDPEELIKRAGLNCGENKEEARECSVLSGTGKINVDFGDSKVEGVGFGSSGSSGKLKLYGKTSGYRKELKFAVEGGDITLSGDNKSSSKKLGQYETYEIKGDGRKYYLSRKTKDNVGKAKALGLPCDLPEDNSTCSNIGLSEEQLKAIKFEGKKDGGATIEKDGTVFLTIVKDNDTSIFTGGYKFIFQSTKDIAISDSDSIKANTNTEFKIKEAGGNLTLERAWTIDKLAEKVGLTCPASGNSNECCVTKDGSFQIQQNGSSMENLKSASGGKIKFQSGVSGYSQGFKFIIEEGNISFSGNSIVKLEEFETYEISRGGTSANADKYFFNRKTKADKEIDRALKIPDKCVMPNINSHEQTCSIVKEELKEIKFDGKSGTEPTITDGADLKLKITKLLDTNTDFSNFIGGYKFTFMTKKSVTIPKTSGNITLKENTSTDFKIKRESSGGITLEKAWDVKTLAENVGLKDCAGTECSLKDKINVFKDNENYVVDAQKTGNEQKISFEEGIEGYNRGFKFSVSTSVSLQTSGNDTTNSNGTVNSIEVGDYEIVEKTTSGNNKKWFLCKKETGK